MSWHLSILTLWEIGLQAAFYYFERFQQIKALILQFNLNQAAFIKESQRKQKDIRVKQCTTMIKEVEAIVSSGVTANSVRCTLTIEHLKS